MNTNQNPKPPMNQCQRSTGPLFRGLLWAVTLLVYGTSASGAVVVDFEAAKNRGSFMHYIESGLQFQVIGGPPLPPETPYTMMSAVNEALYPQHANNTTTHIQFNCYDVMSDFVRLSLTNGSSFGLVSVDLADIYAGAARTLAIEFIGYKMDGLAITNTFTTAGNGSRVFETFTFDGGFSENLLRVDIPSKVWAMDNLVFTPVPEPGTGALVALGILGFGAWRGCQRRKPESKAT
ncbi:MAG: PEP-CTERM sorting domain-containing protein [Verrucomicrobiota bacterium]